MLIVTPWHHPLATGFEKHWSSPSDWTQKRSLYEAYMCRVSSRLFVKEDVNHSEVWCGIWSAFLGRFDRSYWVQCWEVCWLCGVGKARHKEGCQVSEQGSQGELCWWWWQLLFVLLNRHRHLYRLHLSRGCVVLVLVLCWCCQCLQLPAWHMVW